MIIRLSIILTCRTKPLSISKQFRSKKKSLKWSNLSNILHMRRNLRSKKNISSLGTPATVRKGGVSSSLNDPNMTRREFGSIMSSKASKAIELKKLTSRFCWRRKRSAGSWDRMKRNGRDFISSSKTKEHRWESNLLSKESNLRSYRARSCSKLRSNFSSKKKLISEIKRNLKSWDLSITLNSRFKLSTIMNKFKEKKMSSWNIRA